MFQIARIIPIYSPVHDGLVGHKADILPMTYCSEALAHKIAGRHEQAAFDTHSDDSFVVIRAGECPFTRRRPPITEHDPLPF
ncbi:MAG: hypothetical protein M9924_21170 [Rhizobiaceae bacterium]|nr:hypothetical protein [Rhizobiaceae bacterium]